jgi:hypothetical protein
VESIFAAGIRRTLVAWVPLDFVPEGQIDSSLAVYWQGSVKKENRPVRDGLIKFDQTQLLSCGVNRAALPAQTVPTVRVFSLQALAPTLQDSKTPTLRLSPLLYEAHRYPRYHGHSSA